SDDIVLSFVDIQDSYACVEMSHGRLDISNSHLHRSRWGIMADTCDIRIDRVEIDHIYMEMVHHTGGNNAVVRSSRFALGSTPDMRSADMLDFDHVTNVEVTNCSFFSSGDDAIDMDWVAHARITGNRIYGLGDKGISLDGDETDIYIANNIITHCDRGISIRFLSGVVLYNNVIAFNRYSGIRVDYFGGDGGNALVRNCVLWDNGMEIELGDPGATIDIAYSLVDGDEPYEGEGNLNDDPRYIDVWNNNYFPMDDSPLIDAGFGTNYPERDKNGAPRTDMPYINNSGAGDISYIDIGVYEFGSVGYVNDPVQPPKSYDLLEIYPNPFNSQVRILFSVLRGTFAEIAIYDVRGRLVYKHDFNGIGIGDHSFVWNGRNNSGILLGSGVYFCRVIQSGNENIRKLVLIR
ncbi:MAG: right-handed parallel beta-helix repeat-containing protein, partial [Candidatus Electryoneaceae bacterium]|nr:right-handed parallel beta-helix repeat-containing protein [Candidatus Electryoneaceae bacterium]